jgi:outer membrane receptor protein involved in Fe transport
MLFFGQNDVRKLVICALLGASAPALSAQGTASVSGRVTASNGGAPLSGITIMVPGNRGAVTDAEGRYTVLGLSAGTDSLRFRWLGFAPRTVVVALKEGERKTLDVALDPAPIALSQVNVTGVSRSVERVVEAPASVSVVPTSRMIDLAATGQLPLLLADLPGVHVAQSGVFDFNVNSRGFNTQTNRRMLVLVDGRDVSIPILNNQDWSDLTASDPATRVEFIRGPGSALYGANAFSGVLAINTAAVRESHGTQLDVTGGDPSLLRVNARTGWLSDDYHWGARLQVGYTTTQSYDRARTNTGDLAREYATAGLGASEVNVPAPGYELVALPGQTKSGVFGAPGAATGTPDPLTVATVSGRVDYYPSNGSVMTAEGGWSRSQNVVSTTTAGRAVNKNVTRPWVRLAWTADDFSVMAYSTGHYGTSLNLSTGGSVMDETSTNHVEAQWNRRFAGDRGRVVYGGSLRSVLTNTKGTLLTGSADNRNDQFYGLFGQVDYSFTTQLKLVVAGRVDQGTLKQAQLSPKLGLVYSPSATESWRVTVNQGYLSPSVLERFINLPAGPPLDFSALEGGLRASPLGPVLAGVPNGTLFTTSSAVPLLAIGNPDVKPSLVRGVEFGYKHESNGMFITADVYYSRISDFVSGLLPGASSAQFRPWTAPAAVPTAAAGALEAAVAGAVGAGLTRLSNGTTAFVLSTNNFGNATEYGAELGVGAQVQRGFRWDANYTFYGFSIDQASFFKGDTLQPNTPRHSANASATWSDADNWSIRTGVRYEDSFPWRLALWNGKVPSSVNVDVNARMKLPGNTAVNLSVTNLLDQQRFHSYGGSLVGRRAVLSMSWRP